MQNIEPVSQIQEKKYTFYHVDKRLPLKSLLPIDMNNSGTFSAVKALVSTNMAPIWSAYSFASIKYKPSLDS